MKLVFIDEIEATIEMARLRGRSPRGERCRAAVPHGHWNTTTLVAGLRLDGLTAPMVVDGAMNAEAFTACVETLLGPNLSLGNIVVLDDLPAHKVSGVRFVAVDLPEANDLTGGIMALVAQQEREAISKRTREALAVAKARGVQLGNSNGAAALQRARAARRFQQPSRATLIGTQRTSCRCSTTSAPAVTRPSAPLPPS